MNWFIPALVNSGRPRVVGHQARRRAPLCGPARRRSRQRRDEAHWRPYLSNVTSWRPTALRAGTCGLNCEPVHQLACALARVSRSGPPREPFDRPRPVQLAATCAMGPACGTCRSHRYRPAPPMTNASVACLRRRVRPVRQGASLASPATVAAPAPAPRPGGSRPAAGRAAQPPFPPCQHVPA